MISFFLIFFWGLSNKRFTICVAEFSYLFFVLLQLISIFIWVFRRLILIISFSIFILALTFFNYFILINNYYLVNHPLLQILLQLNPQIQFQLLQYYLIPHLGFL